MKNLFPRLSDCRSGDLKAVLDYVSRTTYPWTGSSKVWRAIGLMIDDELRFRDPRREPVIPRTAQDKHSGEKR